MLTLARPVRRSRSSSDGALGSLQQWLYLFGREDVVLRVATTDKRDPDWWVIGGGTPMNLYSVRQYPDPDAAYLRQPPPICSLVSANRPSEIRTLPSRTWTVVTSLVGRRRALALSRASVA